ncbi:hypothetical protein L915_20701 [Phytophthora nicotianae]|uniref:Uncharacterized protein n=3 Tax=Phytophthora nicotianae TaxID=4792 RepID=V9DY90_PHYNI|nr:hypothetical protein F443_21287 [Phytophthora nicotianae P1569]ETK72152.1 hypothetical protein L915_20701 [Phytophthora nicotianae]ETM32097.1 hypothetical protein L914_20438 [Phytophthora nicotianae]ETO60494.1 hypothetical protein F444_21307 [Phytophthora nicotianae P1976]
MAHQQEHNIVTELVESFIVEENNALLSKLRSAVNEAQALRLRLTRLNTLFNMAGGLNTRLQRELVDLRSACEMMDIIAREYFINNAEARARWAPYCSFEDEEFQRLITEANAGFPTDLAILMEPTQEDEDDRDSIIDILELTEEEMRDFMDSSSSMSFGPCCVADVFAYYEDNGITKSALLSMTSVVNEPDEDLSARITATFWQECSSKILVRI